MEQILSGRVRSNLLPPKVMPGLIWSCLKRENLLFQPLCYHRSLVNTFFLKTYELEVLFADSYVKFMMIRLCYGTLAFPWFFVSNIMQNSVFQMHRSIFCWFSSQIFFCAKASSVQGQTLQEIFCHTFLVLQTNLSRKIMWWKTDKEPQIREFITHISK